MIRYTKVRKSKKGDRIVTRIFTNNRIVFIFQWLRGQYEYGRGNSYSYEDIW